MNNFKDLVANLDADTLRELQRSVAAEMSERRQQSAIHIEQIRPGMSAAEKREAMQEIARVLKGEE